MPASSKQPHPRPQGFTLVELMVVVAIIGILASIAMPQLQQLNLRSKRTERDVMVRTLLRSVRDYSVSDHAPRPLELLQNPPGPIDGIAKPFQLGMPASNPAFAGWSQLTFSPDKALQYSYAGTSRFTPAGEELTLIVRGDLDRDGIPSVRTLVYMLTDDSWNEVSVVDNGDDW